MSAVTPLPDRSRRSFSERVSDNIRAEMARQRVTQQDLGRILGLSAGAVSDRNRGRTPWTLEEVGRIAFILGMRPAEIMPGSYAEPSQPFDASAFFDERPQQDSNLQPTD